MWSMPAVIRKLDVVERETSSVLVCEFGVQAFSLVLFELTIVAQAFTFP